MAGKNLLIIDDEVTLINTITDVLKEDFSNICGATSIVKAKEYLNKMLLEFICIYIVHTHGLSYIYLYLHIAIYICMLVYIHKCK